MKEEGGGGEGEEAEEAEESGLVREGGSYATLMTIESDENECACECVSTSVSVSMRFVSSDGDETVPDAEGWGPDQETETCAFQGVPGAVHFMSSWVGHLVTKPADG